MKRLFFVALALVVLLAAPVCAYTLLTTIDPPSPVEVSRMSGIRFSNVSNALNITHLEWEGSCTKWSSSLPVDYTYSGAYHWSTNYSASAGTVTIQLMTSNTTWPSFGACTATADISGMVAPPLTGAQHIYPDNDTITTDLFGYVKTSNGTMVDWQLGQDPDHWYDAFFDGQSYYTGGTTRVYGGAWTPVIPDSCSSPPPTGYVRTTVHIIDRAGSAINGANVDIKDNEAGVWSNFTHDPDGIGCIDTLPAHHVNMYGSFDIFENEFLPNSLLNQNVGTTYYLALFPYESGISEGNVSLSVEVRDADTGYYINYAVVTAAVSGGYTFTQSTGNTGTAIFTVPNSTVIHLSATASGYASGTSIINSGTGTSYTTTISLHRATITPTVTMTTGPGGTVPTTAGPWGTPGPYGTMPSGYTNAQGQMAMDYLAANGLMLVQLCVLVTICALLGFKFGK